MRSLTRQALSRAWARSIGSRLLRDAVGAAVGAGIAAVDLGVGDFGSDLDAVVLLPGRFFLAINPTIDDDGGH